MRAAAVCLVLLLGAVGAAWLAVSLSPPREKAPTDEEALRGLWVLKAVVPGPDTEPWPELKVGQKLLIAEGHFCLNAPRRYELHADGKRIRLEGGGPRSLMDYDYTVERNKLVLFFPASYDETPPTWVDRRVRGDMLLIFERAR